MYVCVCASASVILTPCSSMNITEFLLFYVLHICSGVARLRFKRSSGGKHGDRGEREPITGEGVHVGAPAGSRPTRVRAPSYGIGVKRQSPLKSEAESFSALERPKQGLIFSRFGRLQSAHVVKRGICYTEFVFLSVCLSVCCLYDTRA